VSTEYWNELQRSVMLMSVNAAYTVPCSWSVATVSMSRHIYNVYRLRDCQWAYIKMLSPVRHIIYYYVLTYCDNICYISRYVDVWSRYIYVFYILSFYTHYFSLCLYNPAFNAAVLNKPVTGWLIDCQKHCIWNDLNGRTLAVAVEVFEMICITSC